MERRHRIPPDWDGSVPCRSCGESVRLETRRMLPSENGWAMTCPYCDHSFEVRYSDPDLPVAQSQEEAPAERPLGFWAKRRQSKTAEQA